MTLEHKETASKLIQSSIDANGVKIFIGAEHELFKKSENFTTDMLGKILRRKAEGDPVLKAKLEKADLAHRAKRD